MKKIVLLALAITWTSQSAFTVLPADAKAPAAAAAKAPSFPKVMTGLDTKVSVQVLRCIRANVDGFGHNQVVVVQYRLRKEGPNPPGSPPFKKDKFWPGETKAKDPALGQGFKVWERSEGNDTYSGALWTSDWKPGQTGDGYIWLNVPERVNVIDLYFPYTNPQRLNIEIPK